DPSRQCTTLVAHFPRSERMCGLAPQETHPKLPGGAERRQVGAKRLRLRAPDAYEERPHIVLLPAPHFYRGFGAPTPTDLVNSCRQARWRAEASNEPFDAQATAGEATINVSRRRLAGRFASTIGHPSQDQGRHEKGYF
ncbi:unnamed protein product, partial [Ixodes pacificus]